MSMGISMVWAGIIHYCPLGYAVLQRIIFRVEADTVYNLPAQIYFVHQKNSVTLGLCGEIHRVVLVLLELCSNKNKSWLLTINGFALQ